MDTITLNNGVELPALGLGVFQTPPDETRDAVTSALDAGYRHIDTAAYGNEREVGEGIAASHVDRADVFIETKVWISDYGYDETLHAFDLEHQPDLGRSGVDGVALGVPAVAVRVSAAACADRAAARRALAALRRRARRTPTTASATRSSRAPSTPPRARRSRWPHAIARTITPTPFSSGVVVADGG